MVSDSEESPLRAPTDDQLAGEGEGEVDEAALAGAPANPLEIARLTFVDPPKASPADSGPTMPVSSTADKIKGLGAIVVALLASGFVLNYAFSSESVFLSGQEPKVKTGTYGQRGRHPGCDFLVA